MSVEAFKKAKKAKKARSTGKKRRTHATPNQTDSTPGGQMLSNTSPLDVQIRSKTDEHSKRLATNNVIGNEIIRRSALCLSF